MEFKSVDAAAAIDIFLLLLIGIGPKIAGMRQAPVLHHPRRVMRQRPIRPDAFLGSGPDRIFNRLTSADSVLAAPLGKSAEIRATGHAKEAGTWQLGPYS